VYAKRRGALWSSEKVRKIRTAMRNVVSEYTSVTTAWFQMVVLKANEEAQKKASNLDLVGSAPSEARILEIVMNRMNVESAAKNADMKFVLTTTEPRGIREKSLPRRVYRG